MPTSATTTATAATLASSLLFRRSPPSAFPTAAAPPPAPAIVSALPLVILAARVPAARRRVLCQVVVSTDLSSSSSVEEEQQQAAAKIGKRVRVKVPLKVYHVQKAPDLDLNGLEGVIKQYAGVWKGKRISANLPFKVEFELNVEGQTRPVKFFAHLKEDEFEYLPSSD